jgi:hypothetical protein
MRRMHLALLVASAVLMVAMLGVQIWLQEQQLERQRADFARHQAELAKHPADLLQWQAEMQARRGLPGNQPFMPLPPTPPFFMPPPISVPWVPVFTPVMMIPFLFIALAEHQRVRKQQHEEEHDRTPYTEEELMEYWEFKIIRSVGARFDDPAFLARILQEEALAGWRMLEKFDGARVRLKRLAGQQLNAAELPAGYDPYRTAIPRRVKWHHVLWFFCIICVVLIPVFLLIQLFDPISLPALSALLAPFVIGAIVLAILAVWQTAKYRRLGQDT